MVHTVLEHSQALAIDITNVSFHLELYIDMER